MNNIEKLTELVFVIDRSESMCGLEKDTIGGFNSTIEKQKNDGDAIASTVLFSNDVRVLHDRVRLKDIKEMTDDESEPSTIHPDWEEER